MASSKLSMRAALPLWWEVARQWFVGSSRVQARLYLLTCTVLAISTTWLSVQVSYAQKHFSTGLAEKNDRAWKAAVWEFVGIIFLAAPLKAIDYYTEKKLVAVWRAALTQAFITAYTTNRAYFHLQLARGNEGETAGMPTAAMVPAAEQPTLDDCSSTGLVAAASEQQHLLQLELGSSGSSEGVTSKFAKQTGSNSKQQFSASDGSSKLDPGSPTAAALNDLPAGVDNPDQRITADVSSFVATSVGLALLLGKKFLNCAAFAGVLWSISPRLVVFLISYALMGTFGTAAIFGRPLTRLQQLILRLEADLRFGLVRLRENAEAIAFYGGDAHEAADLSNHLAAMLAALLRRVSWLGLYELWVTGYTYATILIPSLVLAPDYFAGNIEFGTLTQASYAFTVLEGALGLILARIDEFSALAAETTRLAGLLAALEAADIDAGGSGTLPGFGLVPARRSKRSAGSCALLRRMVPLRCCMWGKGLSDKREEKSEVGAGSGNGSDGEQDCDGLQYDGEASKQRLPVSTNVLNHSETTADWPEQQLLINQLRGSAIRVPKVSRVLRLMDGSAPGLSIEDLTAYVPGQHHQPMCVCQNLSFTIAPGESVLVLGPSGCGKSSLLRVIAGLWTVGSGTVKGPGSHKLFFLPQKPFMPLGSLRQQLVFPTVYTHSRQAAAGLASRQQLQQADVQSCTGVDPLLAPDSNSSSERDVCLTISNSDSDSSWAAVDTELQHLLQSVLLGHLLCRFAAGLDTALDWASVLSLGEQQRVALVRLLYHQPSLAFLDEATSALDPKTEGTVYNLVRQRCTSYVSVGHRLQLLDWHSHVLVFGGVAGHWCKYTVPEYRQRLAEGLEG